MNQYDFGERLCWSKGLARESIEETLRCGGPDGKPMLLGIEKFEVCDAAMDRSGADYLVTLRGGATVAIDLKRREAGCSQYWRDGNPELAMEKWSVMPQPGRTARAGWTLDESKITDYTLHTFDPSDSCQVFLLPFTQLRTAFARNISIWWGIYRHAEQFSGGWKSECIFVPADVVIRAIEDCMNGTWKECERELKPMIQTELPFRNRCFG